MPQLPPVICQHFCDEGVELILVIEVFPVIYPEEAIAIFDVEASVW